MTRLLSFLVLMVLHMEYVHAQTQISLDGRWEIIFDEQNEGRDGQWHKPETFNEHPDRQFIDVPSAWELTKQDYEGVAFYKTTFEVPESWDKKIIRLHFGAVNYLSEVWLNNEVVGFHEGGFTPFEFRVDEMILPGEVNILSLRVVGPITLTDKQIDGIGPMETPQWRGGLSGGIWQPVSLHATEAVFVEDVFLKPNLVNNTVTIDAKINHTGIKNTEVNVSIQVVEEGSLATEVATIKEVVVLHPGINTLNHQLKVENVKYWSPANPQLYRATVNLNLGTAKSDVWTDRFGMRELTIKDKDFYLNGQRIYIKASFFEAIYPNGIAYPDNEEMVRREIQLAKEAGFNMIRPWRRPPAPMWLDIADEMGILVVGSPVLECMTLPVSTPYLPKRVEREVRDAVLRDRNHACIVQWELFNELHRPVLKQLMRPMAMVARSLDPTRLILDESGGWAYGANMYLPHEYEPTKFNDIHNYPGPFINKEKYDGYLTIGMTKEEKQTSGYDVPTPGRNVVPGLMSYVSELGYGSLPDLTTNTNLFETKGNPLTPAYRYHHRLAKEQIQMLEESKFKYLYPDMQKFYLDQQHIHGTANKRMIEAVRANPEIDGYCIHALSAGDWILGAGLIDLWRNPKSYAYEATKAANQPRILSVRTTPRNVYAGQGTRIEVIGINDIDQVKGNLHFKILNSKDKVVHQDVLPVNMISGVRSLHQTAINTRRWKGKYTIELILEDQTGNQLTSNKYTFDVYREKDLSIKSTQVALLDPNETLENYFSSRKIKTVPFNPSVKSIPLIITQSAGGEQIEKVKVDKIFEFVNNGGTVLFLGGITKSIEDISEGYPFTTEVIAARGLWTCIPHLVRDHPIYKGLPIDGPMRDEFENVWPRTTLSKIKGDRIKTYEPITASIGFVWFSRGHKLHYSGPGKSWWGADVAELQIGNGRCLISQLRILPNLNIDPVADKLMNNMVQYISN